MLFFIIKLIFKYLKKHFHERVLTHTDDKHLNQLSVYFKCLVINWIKVKTLCSNWQDKLMFSLQLLESNTKELEECNCTCTQKFQMYNYK